MSSSASLVRKRRRRISPPVSEPSTVAPVAALAGMWVVGLFAVFSPGAPVQASHGVIYTAAGALMLAFPPQVRLPWVFYGLAAAFVLLASLSFLPASMFPTPPWRAELRSAGLDTGSLVTAHPLQSWEHWLGFVITAIVALYMLGQKVSERAANWLAHLFTLGVAAYAVICILAQQQQWRMAWDVDPSFGLFPNRNHTATFLAMGIITGVGAIFNAVKSARGGTAGLAALAVVVCLWAMAGYNLSRAGILLIAAGLLAWLACLGRNLISLRVLFSVIILGGIAVYLFSISDTGIKARLTDSMDRVSAAADSLAGNPRKTINTDDDSFDFRVPVFKDTLTMIFRAPWTGAGAGMFRYVFPQYRHHSATENDSQSVHPESDWLMMAAEAGVPAAILLAFTAGLLVLTAVRGARKRGSWPLRLACLVAAMVVPVHGIFDVPGHRTGLAWSALFLLALAMRDSGIAGGPSRGAAVVFRLLGGGVLVAGLMLVRAEWFGGSPLAIVKPERLAAEATALYQSDLLEKKNAAAAPSPSPNAAAASSVNGEDKLETAIARAEQAIQLAPLDPDLHYLRGALALSFSDKEKLTDEAFAIQRRLDPTWVRLPLRQSAAWAAIDPIDPVRIKNLWEEAIRRAERLQSIHAGAQPDRARVLEEIGIQAKGDEALTREAQALGAAIPP